MTSFPANLLSFLGFDSLPIVIEKVKFSIMPIAKRITIKELPTNLDGVSVKEALKLIEHSKFYEELIDVFQVEDYLEDYIDLPGANLLVQKILEMESNLEKIDLENVPTKDVRCLGLTENGQAILEFSGVTNEYLIKKEKTDLIKAETFYSVRQDYFNGLYEIDKYLSFLHKKKYGDLIEHNLRELEEKNKNESKNYNFRLIYDEQGKLFTRAITSSIYKNYNISFSVFVALIQLHKLIKEYGESFVVSNLSLTDSEINVTFRNLDSHNFLDNTKISFALELSNDEIKREAVKFSGVYKINLNESDVLTLKPDEGKSKIVSFKHSTLPATVRNKISLLNEKIDEFIRDTIDDFKLIKNAKKPDDLRINLIRRAKFAGDKEFLKYKKDIMQILSSRVSTIFQLLEIAKKTESIFEDEDIKAKDFWRYKLYQSLIEDLR